MSDAPKTEWGFLGPVTAWLGMAAMIVAAWISMEGRIATVEEGHRSNRDLVMETREDIKEMSRKLDRFVEKGHGQ